MTDPEGACIFTKSTDITFRHAVAKQHHGTDWNYTEYNHLKAIQYCLDTIEAHIN